MIDKCWKAAHDDTCQYYSWTPYIFPTIPHFSSSMDEELAWISIQEAALSIS